MKKYFVMFEDETNLLWYVGEYNKLEESLPDLNKMLEIYNTTIPNIKEEVPSFNYAFDKKIETEAGMTKVRIFVRN